MSQNSWAVKSLLNAAFAQAKKKFVPYLLINLLMLAAILVVIVIAGVLGGILVSASLAAKAVGAAIFFGTIIGIATIVAFIYVNALFSLSLVQTIMQEKSPGIFATIKSVKPYTWGYVWLIILLGLFLFGLIWLDVLTIFIIGIIWGIWNTFTVFAYLEYRKKGLHSLWISQQKIHGKFWSVFWRMFVAILIFVVIAIVFAALRIGFVQGFGHLSILSGIFAFIFSILNFLLNIFLSAFVLAYAYAMYKELPKVESAKTPQVWVRLSIAGWVIFVASIVVGTIFAGTFLRNQYQKAMEQQNTKRIHSYQTIITPTSAMQKTTMTIIPSMSPKPHSKNF